MIYDTMSRFHAYLNTAVRIIQAYEGNVPLSIWLKDYFRQHKQIGSKDRKQISELVYAFYRLGQALPLETIENKVITGLFLCSHSSNAVLQNIRPEWNDTVHVSLHEKQAILQAQNLHFQPSAIFPWQHELSDGIDPSAFSQSFLQQPDIFIRVRPGWLQTVREKLTAEHIPYQQYTDTCIALPNATKLQQLLDINKEAVIQDYCSQQTGHYFYPPSMPDQPAVWDCCAASGGKSIMAHDLNPSIRLTVSDIRQTILHNLETRFQKAGLQHYRSFLTDLSVSHARVPAENFDLIIADVPCSGSGTWARTPEQLNFFTPQKINHYHTLQKKIVSTVAGKLKEGGRIVYITCSVFRKENEDIVSYMKDALGLQADSTEVLKGYGSRADSMFVAVMSK